MVVDNKTKNRLKRLLTAGIVIGFLSELALTVLYSWHVSFIKSSYIYFSLAIGLMVAIGILILYMFLVIVRIYPLKNSFRYLLNFAMYDISILVGGTLGKIILDQIINNLK